MTHTTRQRHTLDRHRRLCCSVPLYRPIVLMLMAMACLSGCGKPAGIIFEPPDPPLTWPQEEVGARIRYVGQLETSADLKPAQSGLKRLGDFLVGKKEPAPLYGPRSVLTTNGGNRVWIADFGGRCLHRFDLIDRTYEKFQTIGDHQLMTPSGLCEGPDGTVYLCDSEGLVVLQIDADSGAHRRTLSLVGLFKRPVAIAFAPQRDELFVVDVADHNIKVLNTDGALLRVLGRRGDAPGHFNFPCDIALDGENLWVTDSGNHRVQAITPSGRGVTMFGKAGDAPGEMAMPKNIAIDPEGHLYVVDARFENIQLFDRSGRLLLVVGEEGRGPGQFWLPAGIFVDQTRKIWVCDPYNRRVQVFELLPTPEMSELSEGGTDQPSASGMEGDQTPES